MRVVIKIGSSSLNHPQGGLDNQAMARIVQTVDKLHKQGNEIVLVSSGSVAAGMGKLNLSARPRDLAGKQAVAAVGQGFLIERYSYHLEQYGLTGAQILLSRTDLAESSHYRNAQNTLEKLIKLGVIPIINENDTVAVEELCFGDNDRLSAMVAGLVHAELLIILTDVDGLFTANPKENVNAKLITEVKDISQVFNLAGGAGTNLGTGGMVTKLLAAQIVTRFGIGMRLVNTNVIEQLDQIVSGKINAGTYFVPEKHRLVGRKRWIAYAGLSEGTIIVDEGAARVLLSEGKSLLAKGIVGIEGSWGRKELVRIVDLRGQEIARGLVELDSEEVQMVKGCHSEEMLKRIPDLNSEEVVHRDHMTLMTENGGK